jgi:hypothetical protein
MMEYLIFGFIPVKFLVCMTGAIIVTGILGDVLAMWIVNRYK